MSSEQVNEPAGTPPPVLVAMLDEVAAWRSRSTAQLDRDLEELGAEEIVARRELEEARRRFSALGAVRREEEARLGQLEDEVLRKRRAAVRHALALDRALMEERALMAGALQARWDAEASRGMERPEIQASVAELLDAQGEAVGQSQGAADDLEHTLSPTARTHLEPYLQAALAEPAVLPVPPASVGVLVSADPPVGVPEALVLVLPVPFAVYADAAVRPEDLCSSLAYRLVAATYAVLADLGAPGAPVRFSEFDGSLAVQVWLGDASVDRDVRELVLAHVAQAVEGSELVAARVEVYAVWLAPELLIEAGT